MVIGTFLAIGMVPFEGTLFPFGFHNAIPNSLRDYFLYLPKTNIPLPYFGMDWGNYAVYPLGMKALPNRAFTSLNRQVYRAIIDSDFAKIERIADENLHFDLNKEVVLPDFEYTALGMACALNNLEMVHYLTKRGVDFEFQMGPFKKTALHIAVENGNDLMTKFLLSNGANLDAKDSLGLDVYDKAEFRGYYHFKNFLDYFKENPQSRKQTDYEEYRYTRELVLEDIDTFKFYPSQILEFSMHNKLNPDSDNEKINLNKFEFYMFNFYDMKKVEKSNDNKMRKRYDNLYYFDSNIKI